MKISILGPGKIGGGLGRKWMAAGHEIIFGVRNPDDPKYTALKSEGFKLNRSNGSIGNYCRRGAI